jgi:DNA (cytosine-5)-methyltransferase 1
VTTTVVIDFCCGEGGASVGYARAGFHVVGVDINPQPRYPHEFVQGDAIDLFDDLVAEYQPAAVVGSPPCLSHTALLALHGKIKHPDIITPLRAKFEASGLPYVIENVMPAPLIKDRSIVLCGGMFGLRTYRHRRFESNVALVAPPHPEHTVLTATKRRRERWAEGWHVSITGDVGTYVGPEAMGIDWMTGNGLSDAIPPAYTELVGRQVLAHLELKAAT